MVPVLEPESWDKFVAQAPRPHLPQAYSYGEGKRASGWAVERYLIQRGEQTLAAVTALVKRIFGIRVLVRVNRGPLLLDPNLSHKDIVAIYRALRQRWRGPLLIAPALLHGPASTQILREAGFRLRHDNGWRSGRLDLDRDETEIWSALGSTFRNRQRHAQKSSPALRIANDADSYEWLIDRHVQNMADKGFTGAEPSLLRGIREARPEDVLVFQMIVGAEPVAGMSVVRFGHCAEYHVGWFGEGGRRVNAGNFLMWEIIKELKRRGVGQFDVGGLREGDGYTQFKRTMRPAEFRLAGEWMSI